MKAKAKSRKQRPYNTVFDPLPGLGALSSWLIKLALLVAYLIAMFYLYILLAVEFNLGPNSFIVIVLLVPLYRLTIFRLAVISAYLTDGEIPVKPTRARKRT
jgi:hypothetical protein